KMNVASASAPIGVARKLRAHMIWTWMGDMLACLVGSGKNLHCPRGLPYCIGYYRRSFKSFYSIPLPQVLSFIRTSYKESM
ncbi:MAG TPA: hypothetical protein VG722_11820, partial [Tepidisphaeraceae bacterium]|nr:hypothetical protein [Tepidisphaeraceae bacterium]